MKTEKVKVVLSLGSNSGDCNDNISKAINLVEKNVGKIIQKSSVYETAPWGFTEQPDFLNQVVVIETSLSPQQLLTMLKKIENDLGRIKTEKWKQRVIDIDILFYDNLVHKTEDLIIPHPFLHKRRFTLEPLMEILPGFVHPLLNKTVKDLYNECDDNGKVQNLNPNYLKL